MFFNFNFLFLSNFTDAAKQSYIRRVSPVLI